MRYLDVSQLLLSEETARKRSFQLDTSPFNFSSSLHKLERYTHGSSLQVHLVKNDSYDT
jgi:hypothetical protein